MSVAARTTPHSTPLVPRHRARFVSVVGFSMGWVLIGGGGALALTSLIDLNEESLISG